MEVRGLLGRHENMAGSQKVITFNMNDDENITFIIEARNPAAGAPMEVTQIHFVANGVGGMINSKNPQGDFAAFESAWNDPNKHATFSHEFKVQAGGRRRRATRKSRRRRTTRRRR